MVVMERTINPLDALKGMAASVVLVAGSLVIPATIEFVAFTPLATLPEELEIPRGSDKGEPVKSK
jgi:hypothetical protein